MPTQDTSIIKEKILTIIRTRGPSLPVHIAKSIGMSILFTSAFLSELIYERKIKISDMRVGSSKIHFLEGQEPKLENFAQHLKSREKDAFELLKQRKFLEDTKQEPAIRVALRAIKDFAIPFNRGEKIIWRYFIIPETEYNEIKPLPKIQETPKQIPTPEIIPKNLDIFSKDKEEHKKQEDTKEKIKEEINVQKVAEKEIKETPTIKPIEKPSPKPVSTKPIRKKPTSQKKNEKFFDRIKEYLSHKNIEIIGIEGFNKTDLTLKINAQGNQQLLIAFNKKRITDTDIIKASKKASEKGLKYTILSLGEPLKKLTNLISALKDLKNIEKVE